MVAVTRQAAQQWLARIRKQRADQDALPEVTAQPSDAVEMYDHGHGQAQKLPTLDDYDRRRGEP